MGRLCLLLLAACSQQVWRDMGDIRADYTSVTGMAHPAIYGSIELPFGSETSSQLSLCSQHAVSLGMDLYPGTGPNGELAGFDVQLDGNLCTVADRAITSGTAVVWDTDVHGSGMGKAVTGWTFTGTLSIVTHTVAKPGDPIPPGAPCCNPLESSIGTFEIDFTDPDGRAGSLANGTWSLYTASDTLSGESS